MNELKSYTEYAVSTPTADFVIGFDFNYGEDAVNVTVDDVPATTAGYTVVYLNETTIRLSPSVPSGVVRLQRETDIDQTDHAYRAGAKFIAQTMDENFEQLRHSQQEVRDGFGKLKDDTYAVIDGLDEALVLAQDAAQDAQDAAQDAQDAAALAQDAADTVNATIIGGKVVANKVLDDSGKTQQQINNYFRSVIVTPELFGAVADGSDASVALQAAVDFCIANKCELNGNFKTYHCAAVKFDSNFKMRNAFLICNKFDQDMISVLDAGDSNEILTGVEFTNVHIDGQRDKHTNIRGITSQEDGGRHGFRFYRHIDGVTMTNCSANYCATDGIELFCRTTKIKNFKAFNCKFNWNRRHGGSGDTLRGVEFISCEFNDNGRDLPSATGTRDNTKGIWGDRPNGKIYSAGFDIEEYAGFAFSQDVYFINCVMLRNTYAAVTVYRTDDYIDNTESKNINFIGGTYDKGSLNAANMSFEFSPFSPWTDYRKAFYDINVSNVDCLGGTIYLRYGTINIANIKNATKISIHGQSACYTDRNYAALETSESIVYVGGDAVLEGIRKYAFAPIYNLAAKGAVTPTLEFNSSEGIGGGAAGIVHNVGGTQRGAMRIEMDSYWGSSVFRFYANSDVSSGVLLHPYLKYLNPNSDNSFSLGSSAKRYKEIYLGVAPIVSSDENLKQQFRQPHEAEKAAALEIKNSICLYKFNDAVDLKGDGARWHVGVKAQQIVSILNSHGLNAFDYSFVCFDEWDEQEEVIESWDAEFDDSGALVREAGSSVIQQHIPAGSRYAIRYEELMMFILAAI